MAQAAKTLEKLGAAGANVVLADAQKSLKSASVESFDFPEELGYMWLVFVELNAARTCGSTPNPITYSDILAYSSLLGQQFSSWEVKLIRRLDGLFLKATYARLGNTGAKG